MAPGRGGVDHIEGGVMPRPSDAKMGPNNSSFCPCKQWWLWQQQRVGSEAVHGVGAVSFAAGHVHRQSGGGHGCGGARRVALGATEVLAA